MKSFAVLGVVFLLGCSTANVFRGQDDFCRQLYADYRDSFERAIQRELARRQSLNLPEIEFEQRNADKGL